MAFRTRAADHRSVTLAAVRERTRPPSGHEDLAALVRSAARPGLAQRVAHYRGELARARAR